MTSLAVQKVSYKQERNLWIGPKEDDLIHLGAKFSPCMREDENLRDALNQDLQKERQSACCVRNDGGGCFQSSTQDCPVSLHKGSDGVLFVLFCCSF